MIPFPHGERSRKPETYKVSPEAEGFVPRTLLDSKYSRFLVDRMSFSLARPQNCHFIFPQIIFLKNWMRRPVVEGKTLYSKALKEWRKKSGKERRGEPLLRSTILNSLLLPLLHLSRDLKLIFMEWRAWLGDWLES